MIVTVLTKDSLRELKHEILNAMKDTLDRKPKEPKRWMRTSEVCDLFQMSPSNLMTLRNNGILKYWKTGGLIYYDYNHISGLLEGKKRSGKYKS